MQTEDILQAFTTILEAPAPQSRQAEEALLVLMAAARQGLIRDAVAEIAKYN